MQNLILRRLRRLIDNTSPTSQILRVVRLQVLSDRFPEANEIVELVLRRDGNHLEALRWKAEIQTRLGNVDSSAKTIDVVDIYNVAEIATDSKRSSVMPTGSEFRVGEAVRVRPGVLDADYPDMPMGGWMGTVIEIYDQETCLIQWSEETLRLIHPVFRDRCENDGLDVKQYCLGFEDLELDQGGPLEVEQPMSISTRPLSLNDQDDRIRMVFDLTSNNVIPDVCHKTIEIYHRVLAKSLEFPVVGKWRDREHVLQQVELKSLDPEDDALSDEHYGIICDVRLARRKFTIPLDQLDSIQGKVNRRLLNDYCCWLHTYH